VEISVVGAASLLSVILGGALASVAGRFPAHLEILETSAGALLIGGLALLGMSLPTIL
jgi:hypothetical protein